MVKFDIFKELSLRYCVPYDVVKEICKTPFQFISQKIIDSDEKPMRLQYLGKIQMKRRYKDANRN